MNNYLFTITAISNGNLNKNRLNGVKNMSIRNRRLIVLLLILILIIIGSFTSIYRIFSRYVAMYTPILDLVFDKFQRFEKVHCPVF